MPVIRTEFNISCVWGGVLTGILLKNNFVENDRLGQITIRIICLHGWLDNLNSMIPLAEKLINHQSNYEIYLYDRAGHGFSSHLPQGLEYSDTQSHQDLRHIIQTLGWHKEKYSIIAHSYGAIIGTIYTASYPEEVLCFVALDVLLRERVASDLYWKSIGTRIDERLKIHSRAPINYQDELTFEKALEGTKKSRPGITDEAAKLLTERSVRRDADNQLHFTRDPSLKTFSFYPYTKDMTKSAVLSIKASVLFIGSSSTHWVKPYKTIELLKRHNPNFESTWLDGPHHIHMTHVDVVADRIEQYFTKYLSQSSPLRIDNSKL